MIIAHKIRMFTNNAQDTYNKCACGTARFAYNWALDQWKIQYEAHLINNNLSLPSEISLRKQLNSIKKEKFPWMLDVTKCAPQMAIKNLGNAFKRFFKHESKYPQTKKKFKHDSYTLSNDHFTIEDNYIHIPKLGKVKLAEKLRFKGKLLWATVSRIANKWYVSISVELDKPIKFPKTKKQGIGGIDLGVSDYAVLSTGEIIKGPKPHKQLSSRLKRLSRSFSRKKKGSSNSRKAKVKLSKLHARIHNIRTDGQHKFTTRVAKEFKSLVIEDLNIKGMMKNRHLSKAVADMGLYETRRQLVYKTPIYKCKLMIADRWYPSSKLCSDCGYKYDELTLKMREWTCPICGTKHDRDHNAAKNLKNLAVSSTVRSAISSQTVCGETGSDVLVGSSYVKPVSVKQKSNFKSVNV